MISADCFVLYHKDKGIVFISFTTSANTAWFHYGCESDSDGLNEGELKQADRVRENLSDLKSEFGKKGYSVVKAKVKLVDPPHASRDCYAVCLKDYGIVFALLTDEADTAWVHYICNRESLGLTDGDLWKMDSVARNLGTIKADLKKNGYTIVKAKVKFDESQMTEVEGRDHA